MSFSGASGWHTPLFGATPGTAVTSQATDWSAELPIGVVIYDTGVAPMTLDSGLPVLGATWDLTTANIDPVSPIAITMLSDSQGAGIPFLAIGLDAPGCSIWINSLLGSLVGPNAGGSATVSLPVPNNPALQGAPLAAQSLGLTLVNPANLLASNGVLGTVGL